MFDFNRIVEGVTGLFGSSEIVQQAAQHLGAGQILDVLQNQGFDLAALQELAPDQIVELLGQSGLDVSALSEGELGQIVSQILSQGGPEGN